MNITITDPATSDAGILIAIYDEEWEHYTVIGQFATPDEAMELAGDHFSRLSPENDDLPPWAYVMHRRNQAGNYVKAGMIR